MAFNVIYVCGTCKVHSLCSGDIATVSLLSVTSGTREWKVLFADMCDKCNVSGNKTRYVKAVYERHPNEVTYIAGVFHQQCPARAR